MPAHADIAVGDLVVSPHERLVRVRGHEVDLTSREFDIVLRLAEHPGWVLSAEQLCVEDDEVDYSPESVSVLVSRLRHKLSAAGAGDVVETVRGAGYRLRVRPSAGEAAHEGRGSGSVALLHDAFWHLQETVLEVDHSGTEEQQRIAADALEQARLAIRRALGGREG